MYKVVLVDDEEIVLEGLKKKINWERLRLQVVGGASNGLEALKIIEETNPDILITDVIMPVMNGLKLMETLKETNRDIKTVILADMMNLNTLKKLLSSAQQSTSLSLYQ